MDSKNVARYSRTGSRGKDALYTVEAMGVMGALALSFSGGAVAIMIGLYVTFFGYSTEVLMLILLLGVPVVFVMVVVVMSLAVYSVLAGKRVRPKAKKMAREAVDIQKKGKKTGYLIVKPEKPVG